MWVAFFSLEETVIRRKLFTAVWSMKQFLLQRDIANVICRSKRGLTNPGAAYLLSVLPTECSVIQFCLKEYIRYFYSQGRLENMKFDHRFRVPR